MKVIFLQRSLLRWSSSLLAEPQNIYFSSAIRTAGSQFLVKSSHLMYIFFFSGRHRWRPSCEAGPLQGVACTSRTKCARRELNPHSPCWNTDALPLCYRRSIFCEVFKVYLNIYSKCFLKKNKKLFSTSAGFDPTASHIQMGSPLPLLHLDLTIRIGLENLFKLTN